MLIVGPGRVELLADGRLPDARLSHPSASLWTDLGLEEVSRQHFNIPVTASADVLGFQAAKRSGRQRRASHPFGL